MTSNLGQIPNWDLTDFYQNIKDKKIIQELDFVEKSLAKIIKIKLPNCQQKSYWKPLRNMRKFQK